MYQNMPPYPNDDRQFTIPGLVGGLLYGYPGAPFYGYQPGYQQPNYPIYPGGQYPGQPGGQYPGQPGPPQQTGPPTSPPPAFKPTKPSFQTFAVDPGAIRGCLFRFTYIWLNRSSFWFYPVYVGRNSVAGYRWRRNSWVYFGIDLDQIESFQCY